MPFPLYDSIDGALLNGYVDGLDNEFEKEDFNPPAETEGRCHVSRAGATQHGRTRKHFTGDGYVVNTGGNR